MLDRPFSLEIAGFRSNSHMKFYTLVCTQSTAVAGLTKCILQQITGVYYHCLVGRTGRPVPGFRSVK